LAEENGDEHPQGDPEEEGSQRNRRVRPLFRFGRRSKRDDGPEDVQEPEAPVPEEEAGEEETPFVEASDGAEDGSKAPVRPVRVVKFVPPGPEGTPSEAPEGKQAPFVEEEGEAPFVEEGEAPFVEEGEAPFVEKEGEAPFVEEEGEAPFEIEPETPGTGEEDAGSAFVFEEQVPSPPGEAAPEGSYDDMERTRWDEPVHDTISTQEEAETGEDLQFRSEESPAHLESPESPPVDADGVAGAPPGEPKPHYHKYLKPDEDLVSRPQVRGPATSFDRDMDADAGEIDFGIDLIDPSERRKKKKTPPKKQEGAGPKKGVGGHDFDAEVDSKGMGGEVGVDYNKRRKRRL
jgi:hypothetical protein